MSETRVPFWGVLNSNYERISDRTQIEVQEQFNYGLNEKLQGRRAVNISCCVVGENGEEKWGEAMWINWRRGHTYGRQASTWYRGRPQRQSKEA